MSPTWMHRTKESEAARQAEARARRQAHGNCIRCGLARDRRSQQLCTRHLLQQRLEARERWREQHPHAERRTPYKGGS